MTAERFLNRHVFLLAGLCAVVYLPALNNGFIADDYPYLEWATQLKSNFGFLFQIPPNNFRMTSFLVFGALKDMVGYRSEYFYVFAIFLHFLNCWLLWKVICLLGGRSSVGFAAAILFAIFHAPQEAVMWLAAMGETLVGLCLLAAILLWLRERYVLCVLIYTLALFSKESGLILLAILPLIQWQRKQPLFPKPYFLLLLPTLVFAGIFVWTWSTNSYIQKSVYALGLRAILVFFRTVNRMFWPWFYILLVGFRASAGRWPELSKAGPYLAWITIPMLPYLFLTYQTALPSRHLYLVSMVVTTGMAFLVKNIPNARFQQAFLFAFLAFNVGYFWIRKDGQFENRARPTTELLRLLRSHRPTPILIFDFPYEEAEVAKAVSWLAPGWTRDLVGVNGTGETCADCVILRWEPQSRTYAGQWQ